MKTIEERINQIVESHAECRWIDASELRAYLEQIASEQKAIDDDHLREATKKVIDKACDAFCKARCRLQYEMCENGQWKKDCLAFFCFKKAMEE